MFNSTTRLGALLLLAFGLTVARPALAQAVRLEAESATFSDLDPADGQPGAEARDASTAGASGISGPVSGNFAALQKGVITFDISGVADGEYTLTLAYASPSTSTRFDNVVLDGRGYGNAPDCSNAAGPGLALPPASSFAELAVPGASGTVVVDGTTGTLVITACYGYSYFDYAELTPAVEPPPPAGAVTFEAEAGTLSDPNPGDTNPGAEVRTSDSNVSGTFTGTGFVALQGGAISLSLAAVPAGQYTLSVAYASPFGTKYEYIDVDGVRYGNSTECTESFGFPQVATWTPLSLADTATPSVTVAGGAGSTLVVTACYGYTYFDSVTLTPVAPPAPTSFVFEAEGAAFSDPTPADGEPGAEARDAARLTKSGLSGSVSGTGFAALQKGAITFDISAVPDGQYTLTVYYASPDAGVRYDYLRVDGRSYGAGTTQCLGPDNGPSIALTQTTSFTPLVVARPGEQYVTVNGTTGTIVIAACYGYSFFDYVRLDPVGGTASAPAPDAPTGFELRQNTPNPFGSVTEIPYTLAEGTHVRLDVYDVTGRRVAQLVDEVQSAGDHTARFDGGGLGSGVYVYRLQTAGGVQMKRMVQVR